MRLWQGVASVPLGADALNGGLRTAAIGLAMHFGVALTWSVVFLALLAASSWLRDFVATPFGIVAAAAIYGPIIWMTMSLVIVPQFTHRPPAINFRWWVQFVGHIPFVALPIVALLAPRS